MGSTTQAALQRQSDAKRMAGEELALAIETYLAEHPEAAVLEDGCMLFDMRLAHYSVSEQHGRCVLQLWSEERNLVRTVVEVQRRAQCLRLITRRMGVAKPQALELVTSNDRRTPTARESTRKNYQRLLERVLARSFPESKLEGFRTAMDLAQSFGPGCVRGTLLRGIAAQAVIGVSEVESSATVDGALTAGILWLDVCRKKDTCRRHFGELIVIVPAGSARTTAERMAWMNHEMAHFQLFTLDERSDELLPVDFRDTGNLESRLVHAFSSEAARKRCKEGLMRVLSLIPRGARDEVEVHATSATEVGLLLHGLEFARVRHGPGPDSFAGQDEVSFGAGVNVTPLDAGSERLFSSLVERLFRSRHPDGVYTDALFRLQPERWLEAEIRGNIADVLPGLKAEPIYSQVPALSAGDRGMLDLLALDRAGRLTVLELKADEDLQLPLQALDYWIRVRALNEDRRTARAGEGGRSLSAFERAGYFPGVEISPLAPRLVLAAPALRIHPANEQVLRYFSPQVEWQLVALSEHWRRELKVVFRKRAEFGQKPGSGD
jgi:hypothetical protein